MVECHSVTSDKKYMYIKFIQKRPFTFWKDVSMHNDGKLRNGKLSPCVCKRIKNEFYFCVLIIIILAFITVYQIMFSLDAFKLKL